MRRNPCHRRNVARDLTRSVRRYLMADYRRKAEEAATDIGACLEPSTGGADPCGAYATLKWWHRHASVWAPNPSQRYMEKVKGEFQNIYQWEDPHSPGLTLATHTGPSKVNDEVPPEAEIEAGLHRLRPHREVGKTHLRAEHFKQWRREAHPREQLKTPPTEGALAVSDRNFTSHGAHRVDPTGSDMDCTGPDYKRDHRHTGHRPARDPVEGGGGVYRHPSKIKPPDARHLTRVQGRKTDGEGYNGVEALSRAHQYRPAPPSSWYSWT